MPSTLLLHALHWEKASTALSSLAPWIVWQQLGEHGLRATRAVVVVLVHAVETFCGLLSMVAFYALRLQRISSVILRLVLQIVWLRHGEDGVIVT